MCGEHSLGAGKQVLAFGSSPRVRGTRAEIISNGNITRIIPACAGNTGNPWFSVKLSPDHPRVCGEHGKLLQIVVQVPGSSPRVRGTRISATIPQPTQRIIPACAGNTATSQVTSRSSADHPRVCGEHRFPALTLRDAAGSSPRVRGTRPDARRQSPSHRIIPACAGNTFHLWHWPDILPDHPRVCGEHRGMAIGNALKSGSSPRVRGTPGSR